MGKMESLRKALFVQVRNNSPRLNSWSSILIGCTQIHDEALPKMQLVRGELLTLFLPKGGASEYRSIGSRIGNDIEQVFSGKAAPKPQSLPVGETMHEDFVDIAPVKETSKSSTRILSLPTLSTLPRPDNLFTTLLPYTLIVRRTGSGIDIEGSHQPTLELISEYFKRHARKNLNDTRQVCSPQP
jgi:hypothetical protein